MIVKRPHFDFGSSNMYIPWVLTFTVLIAASKWTDALLCYSCTDVKNNEECFNVTECPDGEACYGRSDGFQTAEVKHTTGCTTELKPQRLNGTSGSTFCSKTCKEDICNLHICQLGNKTRPPRCLSCDVVDTPNECKNIVECRMNEVCFSEKVTTFQKVKYRFGCVNETECEARQVSLPSLIGKRTTENPCSVCCKSDHCNINACSRNTTGHVFHLKSLAAGAPCADSDAALCATIGRFNVDACEETTVIKACPKSCVTCDHVGWKPWQPWGSCSKMCNTGTKTRSRNCSRRFSFVGQQPCVGSPSETENCNIKHCPVNGKWCYQSGETNCRIEQGYYYNSHIVCDHYKTKTTCDCPAPKDGGACLG